MSTVLFRADATAAMGTGHVMRCLAVAEAVADLGGRARFACAALPEGLRARLLGASVDVLDLPGPPGGRDDLSTTAALAAASDAVMLDGYHFDEVYRAALARTGRRIAAFDDLGQAPLHAGIVVNPSPAAAALPYGRIAPGALLLLGPAYVPLRREIRTARAASCMPLPSRRDLLVTFGGSDPPGLTVPVIERLAPRLPDGCRLVVAVGAANPRARDCAAAAHPGRVAVEIDSRDMGGLMAGAGLAVSAAGGTVGELAALGVPALLVVVAGNQQLSAASAGAGGWCRVIDVDIGDARPAGAATPAEAAAERIAGEALALWAAPETRTAMAAAAAGLVDGKGAVRIARAVLG